MSFYQMPDSLQGVQKDAPGYFLIAHKNRNAGKISKLN
jgi:hypothetical protein